MLLSFAAKDHDLEGPCPGPASLFLPYLKAIKPGKGVALRKEQGLFCILFVAAWTKRMASGGTRPAGSAFKDLKEQKFNDLSLWDYRKNTEILNHPGRNKSTTTQATPWSQWFSCFQDHDEPASLNYLKCESALGGML